MSDKLDARLNAFTSHRPSAEVQAIMTRVREAFQALTGLLDGAIPECREKSLAFTALEVSAMFAMKALALTDAGGMNPDRCCLGDNMREVYYGWRCCVCETFYAFGCEPWAPADDRTMANEAALDDADFPPLTLDLDPDVTLDEDDTGKDNHA